MCHFDFEIKLLKIALFETKDRLMCAEDPIINWT